MGNWLDEVQKDLKVAMVLSAVAGVSSFIGLILMIWGLLN